MLIRLISMVVPVSLGLGLVPGFAIAQGGRDPSAGALAHYGLGGKPRWEVKLPGALREISGLAFSADGRLFAHGDQEGTIWQLDPRDGTLVKSFRLASTSHDPSMGKRPKPGRVSGDFEDIQIVGDRFFLIASTGMLVEFKEGAAGASVPYQATDTGLGKSCEIEGLAYDESTRSLLLLCKAIYSSEWRRETVIAAWSLDRKQLDATPRFRVPYHKLAKVTGATAFHGSALAFAPDHQSLVLIAGPQKVFAEINLKGEILNGGSLNPKRHQQPEGIAFGPDGTLLISDEAGEKRGGTLSAYPRR
jgi:uncharacterized protein YjiK